MKLPGAIVLMLACSAWAEDKTRVPQFTLADGRMIQAVRMIKIATPKKTTYLITLPDGTKMSLSGEDVLTVSEVEIPVSETPASLNAAPKPQAPVAVAPRIRQEPSPEVDEEGPPPDLGPNYVNIVTVHRVFSHPHQRPPHSAPPPPPVSAPVQRAAPTSSDIARRAFSTIPSFQAGNPQKR